MFGNGSMFGMNGDNYSPVFITAYNRTGATVLKGQVAMADILGTQAETTGTAPHTGNPNGAFNNLTPVVKASAIETGCPVYVCADNSIADNALGRWVKCGECEIAASDDDIGSVIDVDKGLGIVCVVARAGPVATSGGTTAVALTTGGGSCESWAAGSTDSLRTLGVWLEDGAADSNVTARTVNFSSHLRWGIWTGGIAGLGVSDT